MIDWHNERSETVHAAVAQLFEISNTAAWTPGEFYIACKMITFFLEKEYGCVWVDQEKFTDSFKDFKAQ